MATELGGMQVTSLMEALPGIASVLRNPVADAFVGLIRAGARLGDFKVADAEEILRYAVRRTLMTQDETERVLAEVREATEKRAGPPERRRLRSSSRSGSSRRSRYADQSRPRRNARTRRSPLPLRRRRRPKRPSPLRRAVPRPLPNRPPSRQPKSESKSPPDPGCRIDASRPV